MKFPVGVQLFSVRDNCAADLRGTLKKIADMGYDGVEPYTLYNYTPEEFKAILDEFGLKAMSTHAPVQEFENPDNGGIDAVAEKYAKIGCDYVALPYIFGDTYPNGPKADEGFKSIENVADACMKYGMPLLYHNHESELEFCDDGQMILDKLYSLHDAKKFQAEFDLGWLSNGGVDPVEYINKYSGRVPCVHMKDFGYAGKVPEKVCRAVGIEYKDSDESSEFEFRSVGKGLLPVKRILEAAEKAGTRYIIVEQDNPTPGVDIMDSIAESVKYLKSVMD